MQKITRAEALKEIRAIAKKAGLTFKRQEYKIGGKQAYKFTDRITNESVLSNCTFWIAYENCMSGYVESYNSNIRQFEPAQNLYN